MTDEMKEKLKKEFKVDDFLGNSDRTVKERLTEWLHSRSESIKNTNSISIYKEVKNSENGKSKKEFINFKAQPEELLAERYRRHEEAVIANGKQNN
jgi:hypothetical protein